MGRQDHGLPNPWAPTNLSRLNSYYERLVLGPQPKRAGSRELNPMKPILLLAVLALPYIFFETFSEVQTFDDQGALMISFRDLLQGRALYHDVFALYGPFYYECILPLFSVMHVPLTHDAGPAISAAFWLAISVALAALGFRITRSSLAGVCTFLVALFVLKPLTHSPLHPQELAFFLVILLLHVLCGIEQQIKTFHLPIVGFICAGLLLTKINLAAFVVLPLLVGAI